MEKFLEIDGSFGEGGGQILRSSLTLSIITGQAFILKNIRAGRPKPGLARQHLLAVTSAAKICQGQIKGAELKSTQIQFTPGKCQPGKYHFEVATAGAMPLVLQTIAIPLALGKQESTIGFCGGTHVPWSPNFEYLTQIWCTMLGQIGIEISCKIEKAGFYPKGGGRFTVHIKPISKIRGLHLVKRKPLESFEGFCILSNLPRHIAQRETNEAIKKLKKRISVPPEFTIKEYPSLDSGNMLFFKAKFGPSVAGFSLLGKIGVSAEKVAKDLCRDFFKFLDSKEPLDKYMGDQLLLPLALSKENSSYRVEEITQHLITNVHTIRQFMDVDIHIEGPKGKAGLITIEPK